MGPLTGSHMSPECEENRNGGISPRSSMLQWPAYADAGQLGMRLRTRIENEARSGMNWTGIDKEYIMIC